MTQNDQPDEEGSSSQISLWEKLGEAFGRGMVKAIAGALVAAGVVGGGSYLSNRQAVHEAENHSAWVGTNFMTHTERENLLQSNLDELHGEITVLRGEIRELQTEPHFSPTPGIQMEPMPYYSQTNYSQPNGPGLLVGTNFYRFGPYIYFTNQPGLL